MDSHLGHFYLVYFFCALFVFPSEELTAGESLGEVEIFLEAGFKCVLNFHLLALFGIRRIGYFYFPWFGFLLFVVFQICGGSFVGILVILVCISRIKELCFYFVCLVRCQMFNCLVLLLLVCLILYFYLRCDIYYLQIELHFLTNHAKNSKNNLLTLYLFNLIPINLTPYWLMVQILLQLLEEQIFQCSKLNYQIFLFKFLSVFYLINYEEYIIIDFINCYLIIQLLMTMLIFNFYYHQFHCNLYFLNYFNCYSLILLSFIFIQFKFFGLDYYIFLFLFQNRFFVD